jgi:hypothetical protein
MTRSSKEKSSLFRRVMDWMRTLEQAMDYAPHDYILDRVNVVEDDLAKLREEVRSLESRES